MSAGRPIARATALAAALLLCLLAGPVAAGRAQQRPDIQAPSAIVVEESTGDVVFERNPGEERQIASTTKLMTALLTLEGIALDDVLTTPGYAAGAAESVVGLREGERLTVRDLLRALLLPSANDAAVALAEGLSGTREDFVDEMNRRAEELGLRDTSFANPIGLDDPDNHSSARDLVKLAIVLRRERFFRETVDLERVTLRSGARNRTVVNRNTLVLEEPMVDGVKTGRTSQAGYVLVGSATRGGVTVVSAVLGAGSEAARDADSLALLRYGLSRYRRRTVLKEGEGLRTADLRFRDADVRLVAAETVRRVLRRGERARTRVTRAPLELDGPLPAGAEVGTVEVRVRGKVVKRVPLVTAVPVAEASLTDRVTSVLFRPVSILLVILLVGCTVLLALLRRRVVRRAGSPMIITVTLNAAIDKTLSVPNFRLGRRHRTVEQTTMAGGKGVNVARALKALGQPVIATGLQGGPTGTRIVEQLTQESILNDFVRIGEESRTNTAVLDPTSGEQTEINERGPTVTPQELELFRDKLVYLARGAAIVVLAGSLPRGIDADAYAMLLRELKRVDVETIVDTDGDPLRHAVRAEPTIISPNVPEAEELVGHEFNDEQDLVAAVRQMGSLGAKQAVMTTPDGCIAFVPTEQGPTLLRAKIEPREPVATVGSGDAFLAGFVAARYGGATAEESLRFGVACGADSTQRLGAGLIEPREVERLLPEVEVERVVEAAGV